MNSDIKKFDSCYNTVFSHFHSEYIFVIIIYNIIPTFICIYVRPTVFFFSFIRASLNNFLFFQDVPFYHHEFCLRKTPNSSLCSVRNFRRSDPQHTAVLLRRFFYLSLRDEYSVPALRVLLPAAREQLLRRGQEGESQKASEREGQRQGEGEKAGGREEEEGRKGEAEKGQKR